MPKACYTCHRPVDQFGYCNPCGAARWKARAEAVDGTRRRRATAEQEDETNYRIDLLLVRELADPGIAVRAAHRLATRTDSRRVPLDESIAAWRAQVAGMGRRGSAVADTAARELHQLADSTGLAA